MKPRITPDDDDAKRVLGDLFGGRWVVWNAGPAGPNGRLWTQYDEVDGRWTVTATMLMNDGVRADDLRKIPVGALETSMNIEMGGGEPGDDLDELPPLVRDPKMRPEDWSKLVAAHFKAWSTRTSSPAAEMAKRAGINRQTVNAWVREARLRGFLPPARRTKTD